MEEGSRVLSTRGDALTAATQRMIDVALEAHDPAVAQAADRTNTAILLVRIANLRFMSNAEKAGVATFKANSETARAALDSLERAGNQETGALIVTVQEALAAYDAAFTAFSDAKLSSNDLYAEQMRPGILKMQETVDSLAAANEQNFADATAESVAIIEHSTLLAAIMAVIAMIIGAVLALLIGRSISVPSPA